jgi:hypothetical protein
MGRAGAVSFDYEASQLGPSSPSVRVIRPSARKAHDLLPVEIFSERSGQDRFRKDLLYWTPCTLSKGSQRRRRPTSCSIGSCSSSL